MFLSRAPRQATGDKLTLFGFAAAILILAQLFLAMNCLRERIVLGSMIALFASGLASELAPGVVRSAGDLFRISRYFLSSLATLVSASMLVSSIRFRAAQSEQNMSVEDPAQPESPTKTERFALRAIGVFVILAGLGGFGVGCWYAWETYRRVAQWPRVDAILVRKEISPRRASLVFQYDVGGRPFTGRVLRLGSEDEMRAALERYEPGTAHRIIFDPQNPARVDTTLTHDWELFKAPVAFIALALLLTLGGVVVYRWSIGERRPSDLAGP
jgi:hypothetical protein